MTETRLHEALAVTSDQARDMAAPYGVHVVSATPLSGGLINTNVRVNSEADSYLLRVYNEERSPAEVEFELSVLRRLADRGVPSQRPLRAEHGYVGQWNGWLYGVLTFIEGEVLDEDALSVPVNTTIGEAVGLMQEALEGFVPQGEKPRADVEFIDALVSEACDVLREADEDDLAEEIATGWAAARTPFASDNLPLGVVHADLYPGNVLVKDGSFAGFIDFDDAYFGTLLFDGAIAAMEFAFTRDTDLDLALVRAFLDGYHKHRPSGGPATAGGGDVVELLPLLRVHPAADPRREEDTDGERLPQADSLLRRADHP